MQELIDIWTVQYRSYYYRPNVGSEIGYGRVHMPGGYSERPMEADGEEGIGMICGRGDNYGDYARSGPHELPSRSNCLGIIQNDYTKWNIAEGLQNLDLILYFLKTLLMSKVMRLDIREIYEYFT